MRKSSEFTHNFNRPNRRSLDKIPIAHKLSITNNKGRNSFMNSIKNKAKKELERKKTNYYSNAKLNIITILSNCINENFYNELSFHGMKSDIKTSAVKSINKIKKRKSRRSTMKKEHSFIKHLEIDKLNSDKLKQATSVEDGSLNNSRREISVSESCENQKSEKKINKHFNRFNNNFNTSKKSLVMPQNKLLTNIKNNLKHNYHKQKTFIGFAKRKRSTVIEAQKEGLTNTLSEIEKRKIDENIFNDMNLLQLKKKIAQVKKALKLKCFVNPENAERNSLKKIITLQPVNNNSTVYEEEETVQKSSSKNLPKKDPNNVYRRIIRKANLFDSIDDEEYLDEETGYYISPNSFFIKIHDTLILFSSLFYFIIIPYFLSKNYFLLNNNKILIFFIIFVDLLYILDVIINCFRAYKNFDETIIKKAKKIFSHYLKNWLFVDLIQAFPYFSLLYYLKIKYNFNSSIAYILLMIKAIKIFTIEEDNTLVNSISDFFSRSEIIDDNKGNIITLFVFLFFLNTATCIFICLGNSSISSWIIKLNIQDDNYLNIYLTSLYFVIVTVTTVGYGDITGDSIPEVLFQMVLLILGTLVYSFIISYISNIIVKISQKSINFKNKLAILNEIKLHHPKMSKAIYKEVLRNIKNEQFYEKKDKQLLFQNLPYYLKNILIMQMYKPIIQNFIFFKDIDNSDFIVKVATSLKPLISIKGDILIQEGDYIKEILFVKKGVMGLTICINLKRPEHSIQKYYDLIAIDKEVSLLKTSLSRRTNNKFFTNTNTNTATFLSMKEEEESLYNESDDDDTEIEDINIIEIRHNEHFGDALMFLNEKCPLKVKIKTKKAELLILKKMEAIEIYSVYPHIWTKINKKSLHNMEQIYLKIEKILNELCNRYIKTTTTTTSKKSTFLNEYKIVINKPQKSDILSNDNQNQQMDKDKETDKTIRVSNIKNTRIENERQLDTQMSSNSPQNATFSEMNNTEKNVSFRSDDSGKTGKKKTLFQKASMKKVENNMTEKANISETKSAKKKSKESKDIHKDIEINNNIYNNESVIINYQKQYLIFNNGYSENSIKKKDSNTNSKRKSVSSKVLTSHHKRAINRFDNLSSTKENSIHLSSSYDNINKMSKYNYINNSNLQKKIKQVIDEECKKKLISTTNKKKLSNFNNKEDNPLSIKGNYVRNSYRSSLDYSVNESPFRKINSFHPQKRLTKEFKEFDLSMSSRYENEKESELSSRHNIFTINSQRNSPIRNKIKIVNKKAFIGKRLNTISKNIQNANEVINNPNEFYMNFFNNIIQKQSYSNNKTTNKENDSRIKKNNPALSGFNVSADNTKKNSRSNQGEYRQYEAKTTIKRDG